MARVFVVGRRPLSLWELRRSRNFHLRDWDQFDQAKEDGRVELLTFDQLYDEDGRRFGRHVEHELLTMTTGRRPEDDDVEYDNW